MLVVPPFLTNAVFNTDFIGVAGDVGTVVHLDSRKQAVTDIAFSSFTNITVSAGNFPYRTFRIQVPVQQIAWQLNVLPGSGAPNIAVRRDVVPNEFRNDAFSEPPGGVGASISLVPPPPQSGAGVPGLSDGTWFVTVYSTAGFSCGFTNSNPVITDVHYTFSITNDAAGRAGWRYYRVPNIAEQLGSLGWELLLSNQVAGTEIAIRRNAVPGRWNRRDNDNSYLTQSPPPYLDVTPGVQYPAVNGFLQQPGHQADVWYIGVYTPAQALGNFVLTGNALTAQLSGFDGVGSSLAVIDQPVGKWKFVRIDVPADAMGWDLRLANVTNGNPQIVVCRDNLPAGMNTLGQWSGGPAASAPQISTNWPSTNQWQAGNDWTGCGGGPMLAMGMGNPLEHGTYYLGVQDLNSASSYTLQSRGIGLTNYSIRVHDLNFSGSATNNSLAVTEGDYFRVMVPSNSPNWKLKLRAVSGEVLLKVQQDFLPNSGFGIFGYGEVYTMRGRVVEDYYDRYGGQKMMRNGDEQWLLQPLNAFYSSDGVTLPAGTFYVLVASEGQITNSNCEGVDSAAYTLTSGVEPITALAGTLSYGHDLSTNNAQDAGEMRLYQFTVPAGIAAVEVSLTNRTGDPVMYLQKGNLQVGTWNGCAPVPTVCSSSLDPYGNYGGTNWQWRDSTFITIPNASGTFNLSVFASSDVDASYQLRVRAVSPTVVPFDGPGYVVASQPARQWHFFQVTVPANALGWDVRLTGITNGTPQMVVCRGALPAGLGTSYGFPGTGGAPYVSTNWPSGEQWQGGVDWTGCGGGPMLAMGMGNPLEPGTYYVGVQDPGNDCSYTFLSRGIGLTNYTIRVRDLGFTASATNDTLDVGEADYYRVTVTSNAPNWKLRLQAVAGEALLKVQQNFLPNSGPAHFGYGDVYTGRGRIVDDDYDRYGGQQMMKSGDEQWLLEPLNSTSVTETSGLPGGTYYVLVASQGQTNGNCEGFGAMGYTLTSGTEPITVLPNSLSYGNDLLTSNAQDGGEMRLYRFNVPAGIASIEVSVSNRLGNPIMYLQQGNLQVGTWFGCVPVPSICSSSLDPYGNYGGTNWQWRDPAFITIPNASGVFSLSIFASTGGVDYTNTSYDLRVRAVPPTPVDFDGGTASVDAQPAGQWSFFQVVVPPDAVGWDIRLTGISNGSPQMVVRRESLPVGLGSSSGWPTSSGVPHLATNWPSGEQWQAGPDWTGCGGGPMLAMGMGNPLVPATYYVGVQDPNHDCSYTLQSRGIGLTNYTIRVRDLSFNGSATNDALNVSEADYYRVTVPSNAPNWKLRLQTTGELLLKVQQDFLPNNGPGEFGYGDVYSARGRAIQDALGRPGGQQIMKPGDEQWLLQPLNWTSSAEGSNLPPGTFFVLVGSQGHNPVHECGGPGSGVGTDSAGYVLTSGIEPVAVLPNALSYTQALVSSNGQNGGEMRLYQFNVPSNVASLEVALTNRSGNPVMYLQQGPLQVGTWTGCTPVPSICSFSPDPYGNYGGTNWAWHDASVITVPAAQPGVYNLSIYASTAAGDYPEAAYALVVRGLPTPQLSFTPELNGGGLTNVASGQLADNERAFYQVTVPSTVNGSPILGWQLDLASSNGTPSVRVSQGARPDDLNLGATIPFATPSATIAPPYLTPGVWYVEVKGAGSTTYSLTSTAITTNRLKHALWAMPTPGQTNVAPGLSLPLIGDSGVDAVGNPLPGDQGIDLKQGYFDFYAVNVPGTNAALLRTELIALSGNPQIYLRAGAAPTTAHLSQGSYSGYPLVDRSLTSATTQYGSWVPLNGRYESQLTPGVWVLAVQASGNANARYRLRVSCGNSIANGIVQDLALNGGTAVNQNLNGGDWRFYRLQIPDPAPANWTIAFSRSLGSARMFIRDTIPPGDGNRTADYSASTYNPGAPLDYSAPGPYYSSSFDLQTWAHDGKNQGPYPRFDAPGTYSLNPPPLRPGSVYYLGFWSPNDTTFSVSSSTSGGNVLITNSIPFDGGSVSVSLPAHGSARYRINVPSNATDINFSAQNSTAVVLSFEQGTIALPGGPAHWTSYQNNDISALNLPNASLDMPIPGYWPWFAGESYYLTVTNTSAASESFSFTMAALSHPHPVFSTPIWTPGGLQLHLDGLAGSGLVTIYSSSNLTSWTSLMTTNPATSSIDIFDSTATNHPLRFYQAIQQQ